MDLRFSEEQDALVQTAREFTRKEIIPRAAHHDETAEFPRDIFKKAWETGLMHLEIPELYGGLGGSCLDNCLVQEEVSFGCSGVNITMAATSVGAIPLLVAGSDAQRQEFLPRLTRELGFCAFCCSEPDAGSDVAGMRTRVTKHGDEYVLNGRKRWITNGDIAGFYTVFATFDPAMKHKGIACFVVDAKTPGIKTGRKENKMGQRASNTTDVIFEDVKLGKSALVGREDAGFEIAMKTFDRSRPWFAAAAAGVIRRALEESRAYSLERKTFGVPIAQHQAVQFMLAEMAISYESTRLLTHKAAWLVDQANRPRSCRATRRRMARTRRCARPPTRCRSSAATATRRSTRSRS